MSDDDYNKLCGYLMSQKISSDNFNILFNYFQKLKNDYEAGLKIIEGKKLLFLGRILRVARIADAKTYVGDKHIKLKQLKLTIILKELEELLSVEAPILRVR